MQEKQLDLKLIEMLNTPVCKMDGKDLVYLYLILLLLYWYLLLMIMVMLWIL